MLATRPAFLSVTAIAVILGLACAWHAGQQIDLTLAATTFVFALCAHAGANVVNDFHDIDTDAVNHERLFPFTGGSRFIQNGVMSRGAVGVLGYLLLLGVIPAGIWLISRTGPGLPAIGLAGLFVAWAYSAPPLRLSARGLGEVAITVAWALVVIGSDYVQHSAVSPGTAAIGLAYGLMVANLLYVNQFPDASADAAAGKRTWVVRRGRQNAVAGYLVIAMSSAVTLLGAVIAGLLSPWVLLSFPAMVPFAAAYRQLKLNAERPARLGAAIKATILATHLFGILLAATLVLFR